MRRYDHSKIEKKWQKKWAASGLYASKEKGKKKKYVLDMFPYPSGEGLHVGHPKGYIATDAYSRVARMQGYSVLHPMGWDAFGLPAENFAIKNKIHPEKAVKKNIKRFKEQLNLIGLDYGWRREINTTDPGYYKWTQWIFLQLLKKGLAYQSYEPINWCPTCQTGLSNEDLEGNACERCGTVVEKRPMRQWVLKITDYADRLLEDLALLPKWPDHIKESQRNWIGRSEGAEIDFPLDLGKKYKFVVLHGFQATPESPRWVWLKKELEKLGHEVVVPELPHTDHPKEEEQVAAALQATTYDEHTILFGHSLGAVVALKVAEKLKSPIARLVVASGFLDPKFKDNQRNFAKKFSWSFDGSAIRKNVRSATVLYDPRDYAVSENQAGALADLLGVTVTYGVSNEPHFTGDTEPDVLMWLHPTIRVFTTRPDTLLGATFLLLAPEHTQVSELCASQTCTNRTEVLKYVKSAMEKTEIERQENKEKTGITLEGVEAVHPATGEKIPVFVADYVLPHYGTGAIMAVPAHDERDYAFAKKFKVPIRQVIGPVYEGRREDDRVRPGVAMIERPAITAIVKHWRDDAYLVLAWKKAAWHTFITGGIEDGQTPEEAARAEIHEETGYKNLTLVKRLMPYHSRFYHIPKGVNRFAHFESFYFELEDGAQDPVAEEETEKHEFQWIPREKVDALLVSDGQRLLFERLFTDGPTLQEGILMNSGEFDGMESATAGRGITEKYGRPKTTYKLRDWIFSRQRYWGEPIPVIHCEKCGVVPVPEKDLPVKLPPVKNYMPTGTGESPLAAIKKWVNVKCPQCKGKAKRETNTMPQWAGSSWYYLRFMDPKNKKTLVDKKKEKYWAPVDLYVGGAEHATRHLIYARFWHKFLYDMKAVSTKEPFTRLISVGLIQAEDGRKMSKRYGNVINPDDIVKKYGADTLRVYEMFMGPFTDAIAWNTNSMVGARRFLERVWGLQNNIRYTINNKELEPILNKTIKKVGEDIEAFKFNTAISQMMMFVNEAQGKDIGRAQWESFLKVLAPFAPHITEELWALLKNRVSVHLQSWPKYNSKALIEDTVKIAVQIGGKTRGVIEAPAGADESQVRAIVERDTALSLRLKEGRVVRVIYVQGRLINFVLA